MLHLIQVINFMINELEYTEEEIRAHFRDLVEGNVSVEDFMYGINLEFRNKMQEERFLSSLPKFESALWFVNMRKGA